jgi:hypothetical protein
LPTVRTLAYTHHDEGHPIVAVQRRNRRIRRWSFPERDELAGLGWRRFGEAEDDGMAIEGEALGTVLGAFHFACYWRGDVQPGRGVYHLDSDQQIVGELARCRNCWEHIHCCDSIRGNCPVFGE